MTPRLKSALEEIEASRPAGEAKVRFDIYGGAVDESFIRGTRAGLVAAGLRLIRAGLGEQNKEEGPNGGIAASETLDGLVHEQSDIRFDWIEISDQLAGEPQIVLKNRAALKKEQTKVGFWIAVALALAVIVWLSIRLGQ